MGCDKDGQKKPAARFGSGRNKEPAAVAIPSGSKRPVVLAGPTSDHEPAWRFSWLDREGEWGWDKVTSEQLALIHTKLCYFETMRMGELFGSQKQNKSIPTENLPDAAKSRLSEIGRDDETGLVELRLGGTQRLWGFRRGSIIYLLWWDPDHKVFP